MRSSSKWTNTKMEVVPLQHDEKKCEHLLPWPWQRLGESRACKEMSPNNDELPRP